MLKKFWNKFLNLCKTRWAYVISLIFIWVIPIIMLNEFVALTKTNIAFKITFMGCLVLLVVFFAFRKKIYALIHRQPHGIVRGVLLCAHKTITYCLVLGVLWAITTFSDKLYHWWLLSGISMLLGLIFIILDEYLASKKVKKVKENSDNETNKD